MTDCLPDPLYVAPKRQRAFHSRVNKYSDETRIGACADWLLGLPTEEIAKKWGLVSNASISHWIRKAGCFQLRKTRGINRA